MKTNALVAFVQEELAHRAVPEKAGPMAAYMKTDMPFLGVGLAGTREVAKQAARLFAVETRSDYERAVLALWRLPHREEKRVGIALARHHRAFVTYESLDLYEHMIREGAWWDFVDEVSPRLVGDALLKDRDAVWPRIDRWIDDADMWVRRAAIVVQLHHKTQTDEERLFRYSLARADEKEFFIKKAIGWALRQYAYTAPEAVRRFLEENKKSLSTLSLREASKHL